MRLMFGTCKNCNHLKGKHDKDGKCKVFGCKCDGWKAKGLLER
jgi:hypothetical protein